MDVLPPCTSDGEITKRFRYLLFIASTGGNHYEVWRRAMVLGLGPCGLIQANYPDLAAQALNAVDPLLLRHQLSHTSVHSPLLKPAQKLYQFLSARLPCNGMGVSPAFPGSSSSLMLLANSLRDMPVLGRVQAPQSFLSQGLHRRVSGCVLATATLRCSRIHTP